MVTQPQSFAITSSFEILGPIMVGPSSSHTAGALRCAQVAASLVESKIIRVKFTLWNSFAHTYQGHGTDRALLAGILGLTTDDTNIRYSFDIADESGLEYIFEIGGDDSGIHPNTVDITMDCEDGSRFEIRGESLGGGKIQVSRINGVSVRVTGKYASLFVAHKDVPGALAELATHLATSNVNIARCNNYRSDEGESAYTVFELDTQAPEHVLKSIRELSNVFSASFISLSHDMTIGPRISTREIFDNGAQLLDACDSFNKSIGEVMYQRECSLIGAEKADAAMKRVLDVMREETTSPIENPVKSIGGFIGGEASQVTRYASEYSRHLMGDVQSDAVARAMAVLEKSAAMGVIVAAPTAGSSGVVPGSVLALADSINASDDEIIDALFCTSAIGYIIQNCACVAGAEGGCQAEVGSAAAMAAAACTQMLGGTPRQALAAGSFAISNLLGLVCDPVCGLVEVPCQTRNAIGVAAAYSSSQLALSNIKSLIPFDEVVQAMYEVGHALPASLRETALGGLAACPSACSACECHACH